RAENSTTPLKAGSEAIRRRNFKRGSNHSLSSAPAPVFHRSTLQNLGSLSQTYMRRVFQLKLFLSRNLASPLKPAIAPLLELTPRRRAGNVRHQPFH
ncbi:MAG: hypothetical protein AAFO57_08485, partial [Pseudomonadota bacterium]